MKTQITTNATGFRVSVYPDGQTMGTGVDYLECRDGQYRPTCGRCHGTGIYGTYGTCFTCNGRRIANNKKAHATADDALAALIKSETAKSKKKARNAEQERSEYLVWAEDNADIVDIISNLSYEDFGWSDCYRNIDRCIEHQSGTPGVGAVRWFREHFASLLVTETPEAVDTPDWV